MDRFKQEPSMLLVADCTQLTVWRPRRCRNDCKLEEARLFFFFFIRSTYASLHGSERVYWIFTLTNQLLQVTGTDA